MFPGPEGPMHYVSMHREFQVHWKPEGKKSIAFEGYKNGSLVPFRNNYGFYVHELEKQKWFTSNFEILAYARNDLNFKIAVTLRAKEYPFYAMQYHPELSTKPEIVQMYHFFVHLVLQHVPETKSRMSLQNMRKHNKVFSVHKKNYLLSRK